MMDADDKAQLLSVFADAPELLSEVECRLLLVGNGGRTTDADSYQQVSWDRYFDDLSRASFRTHIDGDTGVWRSRAWHFAFKNMNLVHRLYAGPGRECRVLDVGCSSGFLRRIIEGNASPDDRKRIFYWGVDVREDMLHRAVEATEDIESGAAGQTVPSAFVLQDLKYPLSFQDRQFDVVVNFEMIKYLPVDQGAALLAEMKRVLRAKGSLYLSTTDYSEIRDAEHEGYMRALLPDQVAKMLEAAGFAIEERYGSQGRMDKVVKAMPKEHVAFVNELLKHHPPLIVAAIITPLYPDGADQVTFRAVPR